MNQPSDERLNHERRLRQGFQRLQDFEDAARTAVDIGDDALARTMHIRAKRQVAAVQGCLDQLYGLGTRWVTVWSQGGCDRPHLGNAHCYLICNEITIGDDEWEIRSRIVASLREHGGW